MNVCLIKRIRFTILFLIYICVLLSCNRQELKTLNAQKLTGEALFQQIVLIEGKNIDKKIPEYVQVVEELSKLTPKELRARKIFNDYIIQEIKNNYPDYFGKLQEAVYSKQLYAIKQTLNEGRNALINTLRLSNKYGGLLKSIEKFAKQNAENYNINSKDGQDRFINDLASYL
ncbi:MAG: hypothetical protein ACQPRH_05570 [Solitalea-like symbiont of Tyrophagus putrescentiae]